MSPEEALKLVTTWNERVARDNTARLEELSSGCQQFVGSLGFQYLAGDGRMIARGVLYRTEDANEVAFARGRVDKYAAKNPDKVAPYAIDYLFPDARCGNEQAMIGLRLDIASASVDRNDFIEQMKQLSHRAYLWSAKGYFDDAIMGR